MAHANERAYLARFLEAWPVSGWPAHLREAPVLEVGSKEYGYGITYRELFPGLPYLGVDREAGPNVDVVCDLGGDCAPLDFLRMGPFSAILCCSVLEHTEAPWLVARNLLERLLPGGLIYVTVPWIWKYHPYPDDYWRLSTKGVRLLFPGVQWKRIAYATQAPDEFLNEDDALDLPPWRQIQGPRVALISQFVCMIGRAP